jgi:hypothetical protein
MEMDIEVIWVRREQEYFCKVVWTGQISLIRLKNFRSTRRARKARQDGLSRCETHHLAARMER